MVGAVTFELDDIGISNFVMFRFKSMILKVEWVIEEEEQNLISKRVQNGYDLGR